MDKKAINVIIVVVVVLAVGAVLALKFSGPEEFARDQPQQGQAADETAKKLPKIIKISNLPKTTKTCGPCGVLVRILDDLQAQYRDKFTVETYYLSDENCQELIERYNLDSFSFVDRPIQLIFLDSEGKRSETQLDWYASKEQIIQALQEVGVK